MATLVSLIAIGAIGARSQAMVTPALVLTALLFCIVIGLPLGIWLARSPRAAKLFVHCLMPCRPRPRLFIWCQSSCCLVSATCRVVVTIIFALPPIIRLTILGINRVPADLIEASRSFGARSQMLFKVQLPLAMPNHYGGR